MREIIRILQRIPDPRQAWKIRYPLAEILLLSILAITSGANSSYEIQTFGRNRILWLRRFIPLKEGVPNRLTIERVLRLLNPRTLREAYQQLIDELRSDTEETIVPIDGKKYFYQHDKRDIGEALYMVSAWSVKHGLALGQVTVDGKSNEITAIPELLRLLDIKGATVTIDAIGCQKAIVKQIVTKNKANYLLSLKSNQPTLYEEARLYVEDCLSCREDEKTYETMSSVQKGHGRIEKRQYFFFPDISWFADRKDWTGLQALTMVRSTRTLKGKPPTTECRYYITSLSSAQDAFHAVRSHWQVENNLHWVLDVVFKEDDWKTRQANSAANLSVLRRLTAALLKAENSVNLSVPNKRFQCALDPDFLALVVFGIPLS